jgi:subtilisin family serine protease
MNASLVAEYANYSVIALPKQAAAHFSEVAARLGFEAIPLDETIHAPARDIDPTDASSIRDLLGYATGRGLYLLQYTAFPTTENERAIAALGLVQVDRYQERTILVTGLDEAARRAARLPFVQYAQRYDASLKARPASIPTGPSVYAVQFANVPEAGSEIDYLRDTLGPFLDDVEYLRYRNVRVALTGAELDEILALPHVIGIDREILPEPSEERQANAIKGVSVPGGTAYLSWLSTQGITPSELSTSGIIVDIVDTGLDRGCAGSPQHPDLNGREMYWHVFNNETDKPATGADRVTHGTMVAGVVAGNGTLSSPLDGTSFKYGLGVAPGLRIGSTKIFASSWQLAPSGNIITWAQAAVNAICGQYCGPTGATCAASIQNHSYNDYTDDGSSFGIYNLHAQQYDSVVRDADPGRAGDQPLAMSVASGNYRQRLTYASRVLPPATAKNVLAMGSVENSRPTVTACGTTGENALRNASQGFYRLAWQSLRTTVDYRYKPELVAPATVVFSTRSQDPDAIYYCGTTGSPYYTGASGTSFAAPYGAGAMALVKFQRRKFYFHDPSPAMLKAMLVAGSKPLTGSPDRFNGPEYDGSAPNYTVDHWPGYEAGFGLLQLNTLFDRSVYHWWLDQTSVLQSTQTAWSRTFVIDNGAKDTRIALAWTDVPASENANPSIVNKLTLQALFPDCSNRYFGNSTDAQNNSYLHTCRTRPVSLGGPSDVVSVINLPAGRYPAGTPFTIQVSAALLGTARRDLPGPNQDFALFVMNARPQ